MTKWGGGSTVPTRRYLPFVGALALSLTALDHPYMASGLLGPPQPPPPQPTFRTEANYVRVDVYPTKDGVPVLDLTQEDFEVFESGAPQQHEQCEHVVIR